MTQGCMRTKARAMRAGEFFVIETPAGLPWSGDAYFVCLLGAERRWARTLTHDVVAGRFDELFSARAIHRLHEGDRGRGGTDEAPLAVDEAGIFERNRQHARDDDGAALKAAVRISAAVKADGETGVSLTFRNHECLPVSAIGLNGDLMRQKPAFPQRPRWGCRVRLTAIELEHGANL